MVRTQISLTEENRALLDRASAQTGLSMSALVREAVMAHFGNSRTIEDNLADIDAAFGSWKDREQDGEAWVDSMRTGKRFADFR
ncbi:MAG: CopG family transcriptional regulator [Angustibacter sp.]